MASILDMDATQIAEAIRQGSLSAKEAVEEYIRHSLAANEKLNYLTQDRFAQAREEAAQADEAVQAGHQLGRLHGVPVSIKDSFHVAGMRTTSGLVHRAEHIEQEDAEAVKRLRREGAIILGKTNTPQLCFCQETDNKLHGRTNNPWDLSRTCGGSSGGEGACVAAGGAAVGLGADIGGSIRFPSHCNGVIGFKSGNGQVSQAGNYPEVTIPEQFRMLGIGALAKSVRDARLVNEIIANERPEERDLSSFNILIPGRQRGIALGSETEHALDTLRGKLGERFPISKQMPPYLAESALIWQELMSVGGAEHIRQIMSEDGSLRPEKEYLRERLSRRSDIHPYLSWALIGARMFQPSARRFEEIRLLLQRGDEELAQLFADQILILPVYHTSAPRHGQLYRELFSIRKTFRRYIPYVAYANVWGLPSLTIPVAEDAAGMPIAVQLISRCGNEDALFQLGEVVERLSRGYVRCTHYDQTV